MFECDDSGIETTSDFGSSVIIDENVRAAISVGGVVFADQNENPQSSPDWLWWVSNRHKQI